MKLNQDRVDELSEVFSDNEVTMTRCYEFTDTGKILYTEGFHVDGGICFRITVVGFGDLEPSGAGTEDGAWAELLTVYDVMLKDAVKRGKKIDAEVFSNDINIYDPPIVVMVGVIGPKEGGDGSEIMVELRSCVKGAGNSTEGGHGRFEASPVPIIQGDLRGNCQCPICVANRVISGIGTGTAKDRKDLLN